MPIFGLGTWNSPRGEVQKAVECAIDNGYRHIDCAHCYGNEAEVGAAIKAKIDSGVVKREDLWITSKLWNTNHKPEHVERGLDVTLKNLGLDYLDMYLIHWPTAFRFEDDTTIMPSSTGKAFGEEGFLIDMDDSAHYVDTWKKMCEIQKQSTKLRSIGVSNFNIYQLEKVIATGVVPQTNQVEIHAYHPQYELIAFCKAKGIELTAYSPLSSPGRPASMKKADEPVLLQNPTVAEIGKSHNKSPAQVLLRYIIQRDLIVIPKSVTPSRIKKNSEIFDFTLSDTDMESLKNLGTKYQVCVPGIFEHSKFYPFVENYSD